MKSSSKRFRWLMIALMILFAVICLGFSTFFIACGSSNDDDGDDDGEKTEAHLTLSVSSVDLVIGGTSGADTTTVSVTSMTQEDGTVVTDLSGYEIVWTSSDNNVATVVGGVVSAKGAGSCTVYAAIGSIYGECDVAVTDETAAAEESNFTRHEKVEATCDADGHITYYTDEDGTIYFDGLGLREMTAEEIVIPAGHVLSRVKAVSATCGTDGNVEYWHCSVCEKNFSDAAGTTELSSVVAEASGEHSYSVDVYNCDENNHWFACEVCGAESSGSITAHTFGEWVDDTTQSDCTTTTQTRSCSVCGYTETQKTSGSGSHVYDNASEYVVMTAPSETSEGTAAPKCTSCGATSDDESNYITLPVLNENNYQISAASDGSDKVTYTYTADNVTIEFAAETIVTKFDFQSAADLYGDNATFGSDVTVGKFTFAAGGRFEKSNDCVNTQGGTVTVSLGGTTNYISFDVKGASGSGCVVTIKSDSGETLYTSVELATGAQLSGGVKLEDLSAGTYYIETSHAGRISNLEIGEYIVGQASIVGITSSVTNNQFLYGTTITTEDLGLNVTLNYDNNNTEAVNIGITTDLEGSLQLHLGKNVVTVTYTDGGAQWTCEVEIYIYKVYDITVSDVAVERNSSGTYITHNAQEIYFVGDELNTDYITVTAEAACGVTGMPTMEFILDASDYTFSSVDMNTVGEKTVTVTANMENTEGTPKTATYTVNVIEIDSDVERAIVNVAQSVEVGEDSDTGVITVNRINDAVKLLELLGATDAERKTIYVGPGEYWEKVEIDMPNVSLIGSNTTTGGVKGTETVIVYDAMNGVMDPSGTTTFSTVGSATFTVASTATGFYAADITFRNFWNTNALYVESQSITSSTQADAAYINADKVIFNNVTFTGYHDTLEAENGRQLYYRCYIEGRTDYIFGNTATAYFYGCTIHTIGAGTSTNNGGYVVATKGGTESSHVAYGYIFNGCNFEGDANVKSGSVSIARGWDKYMTIMVMNCTLDKSYSKEGFGNSGSGLNDRYTSMNAEPVASQLFEYNNVGDGAVKVNGTSYVVDDDGVVYEVSGSDKYPLFTLLGSEDAAKYEDFSVVFSASNGTYSYGDSWDLSFDLITVDVVSGDGLITKIYATNSISASELRSAINVRLSGAEVADVYADAELTQPLMGDVTSSVTVYVEIAEPDPAITESVSYSVANGDFFTVSNGETATIGKITISANTGSFEPNGDWYKLTGDATMSFQVKKGSFVEWVSYDNTGVALSVDGVQTGMTVRGSANPYTYTYTAQKDCELVYSVASSQAYIKSITVYASKEYSVGQEFGLGNYPKTTENAVDEYLGVIIDASSGKIRTNNGNVELSAGTVIIMSIESGATVKINYYSGYEDKCTIDDSTDGIVVITVTDQTYVYSVEVVAKDAS